jgi:hypothetical protein
MEWENHKKNGGNTMTTIVLYLTTDQGLTKAANELIQAQIPFRYIVSCIQITYWPWINNFLDIKERLTEVDTKVEEL